MPRKASKPKNGFDPKPSIREVIAVVYWNQEIEVYETYGLSTITPTQKKYLDSFIATAVNIEEIELRIKSAKECIGIKFEIRNEKISRIEIVLDNLPPDVLENWKKNITEAIIKDKRAEAERAMKETE